MSERNPKEERNRGERNRGDGNSSNRQEWYLVDKINKEHAGQSFVVVLTGGDAEGLPKIAVAVFLALKGDGKVVVETLDGQKHVLRPKRIVRPFTTADDVNSYRDRLHAKIRADRANATAFSETQEDEFDTDSNGGLSNEARVLDNPLD